MKLSKYQLEEKEYYSKYYSELIGATIDSFQMVVEDNTYNVEFWPTFIVTLKNGESRVLQISQDPEGNGPGFIFGLTNPKASK